MEDENIEYVSKSDGQIDFIFALKYVLEARKKIIKFIIIFFIIGIFIAFLTPKEYTSSSIILPQISSEKGLSKKYSSIAAAVGINLPTSDGNKIVPNLYPLIVEGAPFQKAILQKKISIEELKEPITVFEYLKNYKKYGILHTIKGYTIGLPGKIINAFKGDDNMSSLKPADSTIYQYSKEEKSYINYLASHLLITFNDIDGYIKITATMDEPLLAAQLVSNAQNLLQGFIIDYNIKKSKDELGFIEERLKEVKEDFDIKRARLGDFRDRNKNGILYPTRNREELLASEYELSFSIYSDLSRQRESTKMQIEKDTPIFTELQPSVVNTEPSAPNKIIIIIGSIVLGVFLAIALILFPLFLDYFKNYLKRNED